ncbi:MAG: pantoate--beta-alanine ligase [Aggregatilineales bacterium]
MRVIETIAEWRATCRTLTGSIGFVPTMGYLHDGHLALVRQAAQETDHVLASIFVNPTQFGPNEDFANYPRDPDRDLALLRNEGVELVFMPTPEIIYPPGFQTTVEVRDVSQGLEGAHRPGHFRGVATVVAKLFNLVQPDRAYFGQKDAQQVAVIRRMVDDLNFPLAIVVVPTVRDVDGLALSSRNVYLSPSERAATPVLYRALQAAKMCYETGERHAESLRQTMRNLLAEESLAQVEYVSASDAESLRELTDTEPIERPVLLSLAVRFGKTRLIDNVILG